MATAPPAAAIAETPLAAVATTTAAVAIAKIIATTVAAAAIASTILTVIIAAAYSNSNHHHHSSLCTVVSKAEAAHSFCLFLSPHLLLDPAPASALRVLVHHHVSLPGLPRHTKRPHPHPAATDLGGDALKGGRVLCAFPASSSVAKPPAPPHPHPPGHQPYHVKGGGGGVAPGVRQERDGAKLGFAIGRGESRIWRKRNYHE